MKIYQHLWTKETNWTKVLSDEPPASNCLVLAFGDRFEIANCYADLEKIYPNCDIITASTSGEIIGNRVMDNSIVTTAIQFEKTPYKIYQTNITEHQDSLEAGRDIAKALSTEDLKHIFIVSDGGLVNGSELVKSINENVKKGVTTTGGLAGDGARFERTLVGLNANPQQGNIVAVGLYGEHICVGYGSYGGWDTFGPKRLITKSKNNILYELDGKSALGLYKRYLGPKAAELPSSALLFPLSIELTPGSKPLVRTILSINEDDQSMVFAGDLPEGATVQLMKSNYDKLIDGAFEAARSGQSIWNGKMPELAILISCVGRKLVLDQRIEEEVESVQEVIGSQIPTIGFYSYGEISPFAGFLNCELHNQTMTITLLGEV